MNDFKANNFKLESKKKKKNQEISRWYWKIHLISLVIFRKFSLPS